MAKTPKAAFPGHLFEEWLEASYQDAFSLVGAADRAFSQASVYSWKEGKAWPSGDAMLKLFELGCNIHRFTNPQAPMFSDTQQGRFYAEKNGAAPAPLTTSASAPQALIAELKRQAERDAMAERVRALEGRIERLGSDRQLEWFYREWMELEEWWAHRDYNEEAMSVLTRCLENAAWVRAQRLFKKAHKAKLDRKHELAAQLWQQGRERLAEDWEIFFRRVPVPDVGELYDRGPPARGP